MQHTCAPRLSSRPWLAVAFLVGFLAAIGGTYWDDAWHTERGRDSFFIAPHISLYAGVSIVGAVLTIWALEAVRLEGARSALRRPVLLLALAGAGVTLAGAPIDNAWHEAFGRDAVVWSPPHMLGVAGTLAMSAALLLELGPARAESGRLLGVLAGAAVLAAAVVPVLEYETDVPQFDEVWYLPVLAAGASFAFALVGRVSRLRWGATASAAFYAGAVASIALALGLSDLPAPLVPLLIAPALLFDLARLRSWPPAFTAATVVAALYAVYVPYLDWLRSDVYLDLADVVLGMPVAFAAALASVTLVGGERTTQSRGARGAVTAATVGIGLALTVLGHGAPPALAHDPGQGKEAGQARLTALAAGSRAQLTLMPVDPAHCRRWRPVGLTARRAGETVRAPLHRTGACSFVGSIRLPARGRWFLYGELSDGGRTLESWIPVKSGGVSARRSEVRPVYVPPHPERSAAKVVAGTALYGVFAATLAAIALVYRRRGRAHPAVATGEAA